MGINFCGRNIAVPQKQLHGAQVGAAIQKVSGERMAKSMWGHVFSNAGQGDVFLDKLPDGLAGEAFAGAV